MNGIDVTVPYGDSSLTLSLPETWRVDRVVPRTAAGSPDTAALARAALETPVAGPRLRDLAGKGSRVTLAVTDVTRPCPDAILIPVLLEELARGGVRARDVTVLVALGMHRRTTPAERRRMFGDLGEVSIVDAAGGEAGDYVEMPDLQDPILPAPVPVRIHRRVRECDLLLSTGVVEPHQYAGFSGGRKTVAIGCAGEPTIRALHGIPFLEADGTRLGKLDGNPVHAALTRIARDCGLAFVLNLALDALGAPVAVAAGEPGAVLTRLVEELSPFTFTPAPAAEYDLVLAGVAAPKDVNLYQATRALTYLAFSERPVVRPGGWIAIAARCPEGAGRGPGEIEFRERMREGERPEEVVERLRERGFGAGGQRAFLVARALERFRGAVLGALDPDPVREAHLAPLPPNAEGVRFLAESLGPRVRALVVPHGLSTLVIPPG